jgi:uncharacterized protein YbjT (DUF2867 family)
LSRDVFLAGGTGYIGRALVVELNARRHRVRALVRRGSEARAPAGCEVVVGDALDGSSYANAVRPGDTFVQLVGVPHPAPHKGAQFKAIDLRAGLESVRVAAAGGVRHFVYVSVAHPAPVMKAFIAVRSEVEREIRASGLAATILRPWYVLGPGHYWPMVLAPAYWLLERLPATSDSARRLGLVTVHDMVAALVSAVERPAQGVQVLDVPAIRAARPALTALAE